MPMKNRDEAYYRQRIAEERARASATEIAEAKAAHIALAKMYQRHLEQLIEQWGLSRH